MRRPQSDARTLTTPALIDGLGRTNTTVELRESVQTFVSVTVAQAERRFVNGMSFRSSRSTTDHTDSCSRLPVIAAPYRRMIGRSPR